VNAPTQLPCPTCKRSIVWSDEFPFRPFCSERCKMVDLGAWLTEQHAIPGEPVEGASEGAVPDTQADDQR
jgi:endogenous inhibitor of DNA gyrase (YacG/DUF329 family)